MRVGLRTLLGLLTGLLLFYPGVAILKGLTEALSSEIGYMTIETPWGHILNRGPVPINNVVAATTRRRNWTIPVSPWTPPGVYNFTGWIEMDGVIVDLKTDSIEVVP